MSKKLCSRNTEFLIESYKTVKLDHKEITKTPIKNRRFTDSVSTIDMFYGVPIEAHAVYQCDMTSVSRAIKKKAGAAAGFHLNIDLQLS